MLLKNGKIKKKINDESMKTNDSDVSQFIQGSADMNRPYYEMFHSYESQAMTCSPLLPEHDSPLSPGFKIENDFFSYNLDDIIQWLLNMTYSGENETQFEVNK